MKTSRRNTRNSKKRKLRIYKEKLNYPTMKLKKSTNGKVVRNSLPILDIFRHKLYERLRLKDIEEELDLSHQTVYRKLKIAKEGGLLKKEDNYYRVNLENELALKLLEFLAVKERNEFLEKYGTLSEPLRKLMKVSSRANVRYLILFGSYAKEKATETSDIDLLVVGGEKEKIEKTVNFLETSYRKTFSPIFARKEEIEQMINNRKKFMKDIIRDGIVLHGENEFYRDLTSMLKEW